MNLTDIAGITGQKSVSDMTDEELREHLRLIRKSRMETKQSDRRMTEKPDAVEGYEKPKRAKAAKKKKEHA